MSDHAKFIQIAGAGPIYALDDAGQVWTLEWDYGPNGIGMVNKRWIRLDAKRIIEDET